MGPQHKTEQQRQQQLPVDGLSDSEALAREELCLELSYGKEEAATTESQPLVKRNPSLQLLLLQQRRWRHTQRRQQKVVACCAATGRSRAARGGRNTTVRRPRKRRGGSRHPRLLREEGWCSPQREQQGVQEGIAAKTKGVLRVCGKWKEYRDANSGRLYYVNTETKQRTWKIKETPFANE
ncbi:hypothetical protein TcBrA4_0012540 [Trypanosoma cruzi]|nr:hypothetical protein TcBrA4_0012540 [Trypanosoma cruzi]